MASSSSSSKRRRSYDVFLSFRGTDVRNNFVGHLYTALDWRGINTYMDSEELRTGEQISPALTEAIEESRIAIVVFSENYAFSKWCLDELAKIMECKEQRDLLVFPVFYKVEPCEVRTPRESYRKAMAKHEDKYGKDSEKVKRWKKALFGAGSLSGQHFTDGYEPGFVQDIVQEISTQLDPAPLHVAKYPIGIDSRVQELKAILNMQSKDDVLMVGLWGHGGVGKTTLAKAVYNAVFREFQGSCYLERVRENSNNSNNLVPLQKKLLSQILLGKSLTVQSDGRGRRLIQDKLCNKKVLIILDDVDDQRQLNALVGNGEWFGQGSRIIITTRNRHLLTSHGVVSDHICEVKALKSGEALQLLRKHASLANHKIEITSNLVDKVLHYANGLPLALEVLGSFLCGREEDEWESALKKLAESPDKQINDVLKVGYEGLEDYAKEIFLDIACFFKGWSIPDIKKVLDSCGFHTTIGLKVLIEGSWISEEEGTFQMHDLRQLMGRDIVKEECRDDPGKRSRLWLYDDVLDVLSRDLGTAAVKAIVLKLPELAEMDIGPNAFTKMRKLRVLILHNVHNPFQGPMHFPNELRWFEWPNCASIPEFGGGEKKLVGLDLRNTNVQLVLKQFQGFEKLKFVNFSECQSLVCMPDFGGTPDLEELDLSGCNNLERAHESVAYHDKLQLLNLSGCSKLHPLDVLELKNLQRLILANCSKLQRFPNGLDRAKHLGELDLHGTSIEKLPVFIENLVSLKRMDLRECKKLAILPSSIYQLRNLRELFLGGCSELIKFPKKEGDSSDPHMKTGFHNLYFLQLSNCNLSDAEFLENPSCFPSLGFLIMDGNKFTNLPTTRQLSKLHSLDVKYCEQLQEILEIPSQLTLKADGCKSLSKIPSFTRHKGNINLSMCQELVRNGSTINDLFKLEHVRANPYFEACLPGGEMPEWLVRTNEGHLSFMASKDLFEKFIGAASCVVFRGNRGQSLTLEIRVLVNGKTRDFHSMHYEVDSDHVALHCSKFWGGRNHFGPNDWSHFQLIITAFSHAVVKKCGFLLIFKPLGNDLEVFRQHNPSLDPNLLYMVRDDDSPTSTMEVNSPMVVDSPTTTMEVESPTSTMEESSNATEDLLVSKTSTEENSSSNLVPKGSNMADSSLQRFWVEHEDNQTNTEGNSSNEREGLQDCQTSPEEDSWSTDEESDMSVEKLRYYLIPDDYRKVCPVRPGEEMPKMFAPVEDDTICYMVSQDLYDKFIGLDLYVVFCVEDGEKEISFDIVPCINDQQRNVLSGTLGSFDSEHIWCQFLKPNVLWGFCQGEVDFGQFDERLLRFSLKLKVSGGTLKKLGHGMRCREITR